MGKISSVLGQFFELIHSGVFFIIPNKNVSYGLAIILFTIIIRLILLPLNIKQIKSQVKMNEIQPKIKKLQTKYKNNPQKANEEMMKIYKEEGINPFSGCLPMLIQMPIIIALFYVFKDLQGINGVGFLWIKDLSKPDQFYILPILSGLTTYLSSVLLAPKDDGAQAMQAKTMSIFMSIFLVYVGFKFQASLVLYWVINNIFQTAQTLMMKKNVDTVKE